MGNMGAHILDQLTFFQFLRLISRIPVCKQNNARLNLGAPATPFAPPQLKVLG
jgi:hypothetical protein